MKRPTPLSFWILSFLIASVVGYLSLTGLIPQVMLYVVQKALGRVVTVESAKLLFPFTLELKKVLLRVPGGPVEASIQRMVLRPQSIFWAKRMFWFHTVEIEKPVWRVVRTKEGMWLGSDWFLPASSNSERVETGQVFLRPHWSLGLWHIGIMRLSMIEGAIEFIGERPANPFHGLMDHLAIEMGTVTLPSLDSRMTFAIHAQLVAHEGYGAPVYCSGWLDVPGRDLEALCRLEPLALMAFEPYYAGAVQLRVYGTTVESTGRWTARANALEGQLQWVLGNLTEGDLSIRGKTILDVKKLSRMPLPLQLSWQLTMAGLLDHPDELQMTVVPGSSLAQQLMDRWVQHGVHRITFPFFGHPLNIHLAAGSDGMISDVQATSKQVLEALEILTMPVEGAVADLSAAPNAEGQQPPPVSSSTHQSSTGLPTVPVAPTQVPAMGIPLSETSSESSQQGIAVSPVPSASIDTSASSDGVGPSSSP